MPRARFVHPEMMTDADFAELTPYNRLFFVYTLTLADDAGNFPNDARELKAKTFPYNDEVPITDIVEFLAMLTERTMYVPYTLGDRSWYHIRNFNKYQRPERPTAPRNPLYPGQIYTFSYREKGKWFKRSVTADEWNKEAYGERSVKVQEQSSTGRVVRPYTCTTTPTAPEHPGSPPSPTGSPGTPATPPRKPTRLNFEIPRHWDAMQEASRLGLNLAPLDTLEKLEEEIALVKSGAPSEHQWVKNNPLAEKST